MPEAVALHGVAMGLPQITGPAQSPGCNLAPTRQAPAPITMGVAGDKTGLQIPEASVPLRRSDCHFGLPQTRGLCGD